MRQALWKKLVRRLAASPAVPHIAGHGALPAIKKGTFS